MQLIDLNPPIENMREEVLRGLMHTPKSISPKYFYDERGSKLFERICELEEYYLTRSEISVLEANAEEIAGRLGARCFLFEFGSGAGRKTKLVLDKLERPAAYAPVDISREMLLESAERLSRDYPRMQVVPVLGDFNDRIEIPDRFYSWTQTKAAFFPGSTIGNLDPEAAIAFFERVATLVGNNGMFLVGVDLLKDPHTLEAAYNDARGVTAAFNLNLLERFNRELGADFDLSAFRHLAFFNSARSRIEMHLESLRDQTVTVSGTQIDFRAGETIHTESSYKYSPEQFDELVSRTGFRRRRFWTDENRNFGVFLFEYAPQEIFDAIVPDSRNA